MGSRPLFGASHLSSIRGYRIMLAAILVIGLGASVYAAFIEHRSGRENMLNRVETIAAAVSEEDIRALSGGDEDVFNPVYHRLKSLFTDMRAANEDIRFIYINGIRDGTAFFYVDSEDPSSEDYSPPGQPYEEATDLMYENLENGTGGFEVDRDRWGFWMSAYAPILEREGGKAIALVGIDVPAEKYIFNIISYGAIPLLLTIIVALTVVFTARARRREMLMIEQKAEFFSIATHEIRTPLTGMRWAVESVLGSKNSGLPKDVIEVFNRLLDNTVNLINRLNNILDMSVIDAGKAGKTVESIPVREVLEQIRRTYTLTAMSRGVELSISSSVPENLRILYNRENFWRIMVNLVANAVKYTRDNTAVEISFESRGEERIFSVSDQGPGISSEDMKHIFDGYVRTDAARRSEQSGTGIGLALSQKIAALDGGYISVASKEGEGSVFSLHLREKEAFLE